MIRTCLRGVVVAARKREITGAMAHKTDIHVGTRLREIRLMRGMTQTELSEKLGISFQQVQKYEKGTNRIGSSRLWDMAQVLGTPIESFFEGLEGAEPSNEAVSRRTIQLARAIDDIGDDDVKFKFLELVRAYRPSPQP